MVGQARSVVEAYEERFPSSACSGVWRAPGRVNLIGEHTDYNLGFVLPIALDMACYSARGPADDGRLNVYSRNMKDARSWPVDDLLNLTPSRDWSDYVVGVAIQLVKAGYPVEPSNLLIDSAVPFGGGLSSSASLEVSVALALLGGAEMDPVELAKLARRAENEFAGMPCGIMDQYISVFGQEDSALKIDCRSLGFDVVRLPAGVNIIAVNSMVKHELGGSAYRDRVAECAAAAAAIRAGHPEVESLRDASLDQLNLVGGIPQRRARHIITENQRVEDFVAAAAAGDLPRMGGLFVASHRSLQHDYEVSCEELDFLVDTAIGIPGVYGSRMTGGGFGGCTVSLVSPQAAARFQDSVARVYHAKFGIQPRFYACKPSQGAGKAEA